MARQKNEMYGRKYKACPCAQVVQRDTAYTAELIEPTCYSPKRAYPKKISRRDIDQVRICIGGTAHGKKYTSCPYYVRNANTGKAGVVKKSTIGGFLTNLIMPVLFGYIALQLFEQGDSSSLWASLFFAFLAVIFFLPTIKPRDYIQSHKRSGKKK